MDRERNTNFEIVVIMEKGIDLPVGRTVYVCVCLYVFASQRPYTDFQQMSIQWIVNI